MNRKYNSEPCKCGDTQTWHPECYKDNAERSIPTIHLQSCRPSGTNTERCTCGHMNMRMKTEHMTHQVNGDMVTECKKAVILAAFGIQALGERELLDRLENLYLAGVKAGYEAKG